MNFEEFIKPFFFVEHENSFSFCLSVGEYKNEIFQTRSDEGFLGNGYDWGSLAFVFLEEKMPELLDIIKFDSESSMFCGYSSNEKAIKEFAIAFKEACEDTKLITSLFSRAELD